MKETVDRILPTITLVSPEYFLASCSPLQKFNAKDIGVRTRIKSLICGGSMSPHSKNATPQNATKAGET